MPKKVFFKGSPLTLVGREIKVGDRAPNFKVSSKDLKEAGLDDFKGKIKILTSFLSLDTPVCDLQVKEFNKRAASLAKDVVILGLSKDLPFAQARFCEMNNITNVQVLSDYKYSSFGINYGLLIKELNLLARAIVIIDKEGRIRYIQIVEEETKHPDYDDALKNLEQILAKGPIAAGEKGLPGHCVPCEAGTAPLPKERVDKLMAQYSGWELIEDKKLRKEFKFKDFVEAKYFIDLISEISEEQGHHPTLTIIYNKVLVTLSTHAAGGLTDNDFLTAKFIDQINFKG